LQTLGQAETKLLYTLHWILLFAADECADADIETTEKQQPRHTHQYLFSIPTISVIKTFLLLFISIYIKLNV